MSHADIETATASSVLLRQKILKKCREDIYHFLNHENGQIAIYDAVNPLASGRRSLAKEFAKHDIEVCCARFVVQYRKSDNFHRLYLSSQIATMKGSSRKTFEA